MFLKQPLKNFPQNYTLENTLIGEGAYAKVKKATVVGDNTQVRAVKMIDMVTLNREECSDLKKEIDILNNLHHPNIMRLHEVYENKSMIYLVTEYCDGHDLLTELESCQRFNER